MTRLPLSIAALLLLLAGGSLRAEWAVTEREALPGAPGVAFSRLRVAEGAAQAELHVVLLRGGRLAVIDNPGAAESLAAAAESSGALAAVNGGFFQPDYTPLGLLIGGGRTLHPLEQARLLSGVLCVTGGRGQLLRTAEYRPKAAMQAAVQAGPVLIDRGAPVPGLNATRSAARTVVLVTAQKQTALLICRDVTLAQMAQILATPGLLPQTAVTRALNLDGGSSTGLWVRTPGGAAFSSPEWKRVRDFVAVLPE